MSAALPESLVNYLAAQDAAHAESVRIFLASLTDHELGLVHDVAVMGYVRGTMHPEGERIPKDGLIMAEVIDACLAFPDLYPTVSAGPVRPDEEPTP